MAILDTIKNQILTKPGVEQVAEKSDKKPIISKLCPICHGCTLEFYADEEHVKCYACEQSISVAELLATTSSGERAAVAPAGAAATVGFITVETPESGLIYLENRFLNHDWKNYGKTTTILLADIESMVQSNNIKQGAHPASWLLDFNSVSVPISKKIEALQDLSNEISEIYSATDTANVLALFDRSKNIAMALADQKDALLGRLANDITFAEKLGLEQNKLETMKSEYESLKTVLDEIKPLKKLTDIPAVAKKQEEINQQMIASFRDKGIDVVAEYEKALYFYNKEDNDKRDALRIFESIRGYADSNDYISKINNYFNYYGKFFNFFGKNYVYKTHKGNSLALDPKAKDGKSGCLNLKKKGDKLSEEEAFPGDTLELYEVVDKEPAEEPVLKWITNIIRYYGSVLYYVKLDNAICAYDMATKKNEVLLKVEKPEDLKVFIGDTNMWVYGSSDGKSIYIRKRLDIVIEKTGCKDKLLGKKDTILERRNNYEVYELNFAKCTCDKVIDRVVDIIDQGGDFLFYTVADELAPGQKETEETKKELAKLSVMALNTSSHEQKLIFKENCDIRKICGNKIIYTLRTPNRYNLDLHIFDMSTMTDTLIESNVRDFLDVSDGRIFYYVGNKSYSPLFSNNFEGTDRIEVMTNIERVIKVLAGWMYVVKGSGRNALLMKISTDGKQRFVICSQFQKDVKITDTYIYYVTSGDDLRVVRTDGKENTLIAENIDLNNVQIDKERIYYLRREWTGRAIGSSLYVMDIDGHNVRKLLFNVRSMKNYDENTLYVERDDQIRFHIVFPAPRKKDEKEYDETFDLSRYYKFNKHTGEMDNILTVGIPHPSKYQAKGCLIGKKKDLVSVFTEIPIEDEFEEKGERAGSAISAQIAEQQGQAPLNPNNGSQGCGNGCTANNNGCSNGCLGSFKK